jgi:hypothetical protein
VLTVSAVVSVAGNAAHAIMHAHTAPAVAAVVAVVPPIALLTAVHGVTILLRAPSPGRATHRAATLMTMLIAAAAFWLSFTALRSLAELAGIPHQQTWLWPLIIEGSMTQATTALIALSRPHPGPRAAYGTASTENMNLQSPTDDDIRPPDPIPEAVTLTTEPVHTRSGDHQWAEIATIICARDPARRRDPADIIQILTWHHDDGLTPTEIARRSTRSRSTISRILDQAAQLDRPEFARKDPNTC